MKDMYYNKKGKPITLEEWGKLHNNPKYKRIRETTLSNGKWVSTVWLGINHSFQENYVLIFETMVFSTKDSLEDLDCERYFTEEEAIEGYEKMCKKWE